MRYLDLMNHAYLRLGDTGSHSNKERRSSSRGVHEASMRRQNDDPSTFLLVLLHREVPWPAEEQPIPTRHCARHSIEGHHTYTGLLHSGFFSRDDVIVKGFIILRALPPSAYESVSRTAFLPHF